MIWCSVIWIAFSVILTGMFYLISDRVEENLIREELSKNMSLFAANVVQDEKGDFSLKDMDGLESEYYCVILDRDYQYVFGDCPSVFKLYTYDAREKRDVEIAGVHYLLEYRQHLLSQNAGIRGGYKVCGIVREEKAVTVLEKVRIGVYGFVIISLVLLIGLNLFLQRRIALPLQRMGEEAQSMGSRMDFSADMTYESGFREIDMLAGAYQEVFRKMENVIDSQNQFNSDVSHELRTPLTVLQAKSQVAREYAEKIQDANYIETLEVLDRQTDKMKKMINDLMSLSRLKSGEMALSRETFDLAEVAESVCEDETYLMGEQRQLECSLSEAQITADVNLIVIAVQNLLSNAVKYSAGGSVIRVSCGIREGRAFLNVQDEGIGISQELHERIFDHFYRAEESRTSEGFGLGLTLTRKIMELHGGQVLVESEPGKGSTFTLLFSGTAPENGVRI